MEPNPGPHFLVGFSGETLSVDSLTVLFWGKVTLEWVIGAFFLSGHMGIVCGPERVLFKLGGALDNGKLEIVLSEGVWTDQHSCSNLRQRFGRNRVVNILCEEENGTYIGKADDIEPVQIALVPVTSSDNPLIGE